MKIANMQIFVEASYKSGGWTKPQKLINVEVSYKRGGWTKLQKLINVEYQIRPWRVEFDPKINKRGVHYYSAHKSRWAAQKGQRKDIFLKYR